MNKRKGLMLRLGGIIGALICSPIDASFLRFYIAIIDVLEKREIRNYKKDSILKQKICDREFMFK